MRTERGSPLPPGPFRRSPPLLHRRHPVGRGGAALAKLFPARL